MTRHFKPRTDVLPAAQKEIWTGLAAAPGLGLVLYGGTAVALHLGHRVSVDFDFFSAAPLDKERIVRSFAFMANAVVIQEAEDTLVAIATMASGTVKVSFFGGISTGRINDPMQTEDGMLLVASLEDLLATKLKAILDRAEAKDYRDISALLSAGVLLDRALGAFAKMYDRDPVLALRALGFFKDGDLPSLPKLDQDILRTARDRIVDIPSVSLLRGLAP
jgi:hypothetical protein